MRKSPLRAFGAATGAALLAMGAMATPASAAPATTEIQILGFNDFHGRLEATAATPPVGGAAQLAGLINSLRTENPNTLVVSAGDNIGASPFISAVQQDKPTLDFLNVIDLDVSAVGNHEFDKGFADLDGRVNDLANFPYLGANVYKGGSPALEESFVKTVDGVKVGFVGVVTEETASLVSPDGIAGIEFKDPTTEANRVAAKLKAEGAALVVLLAHEGSEATDCAGVANEATDFGKIVKGASANINAIVSAHTHREYNCSYPVTGLGHERVVLQSGQYGALLGQLNITVTDGAVTAIEAENVPVSGITPDPAVAELVAKAKAEADVIGLVEVGEITADITRAKNADGSENRGAESTLGNFIADVQFEQTKADGRGGAQIAFMNPGGLRDDLLKGDDGVVTYADLAAVQPFANDLVTVTLTGAQIKSALEQQWQPAGSSRPYLHLGVSKGFSYVFDPDAAAGSRIVRMTLNGTAIDPAGTYRVTINSFLASGGDNFAALGEGTNRTTTGDNDLTMLVAYFEANSPITADTAKRAVHVDDAPPAGGGGGGDDPGLPVTGAATTGIVTVGLLLLIGGVVAAYFARRRRVVLTTPED
ncbi:bifunctional UDP-sugar hydrolase/5'-nucleotidase [Polymorphospora sp. NPDC051019]|uniref:bifunctional metallophosphatase/5'-nucleotidase n=1 Tax=Polymorphospora sp. NPDC051019 TaxID=3155725 RepID=UPI003424F116